MEQAGGMLTIHAERVDHGCNRYVEFLGGIYHFRCCFAVGGLRANQREACELVAIFLLSRVIGRGVPVGIHGGMGNGAAIGKVDMAEFMGETEGRSTSRRASIRLLLEGCGIRVYMGRPTTFRPRSELGLRTF